MNPESPPGLAQEFLRRSLPPGVVGESIKGDLDQEYRDRLAARPEQSQRWWYMREAGRLGARYLLIRLLHRLRGSRAGEGASSSGSLERVRAEIGLSLRRLRRSPGLALFAILAMGLGIGATTTMFSFTNLVFVDLPFEDSHRLVTLSWDRVSSGRSRMGLTLQEFAAWRGEQTTLQGLAAFERLTTVIADETGVPERIRGARVSANAFEALGVQPSQGRNFLPGEEEPDGPPVVILSHDLWSRRYGGDREMVGRTIRVNGIERTIVGVMPRPFQFPMRQNVWIPLEVDPTAEPEAGTRALTVFGRLGEGIEPSRAEAEFTTFARRLGLEKPHQYDDLALQVKSYREFLQDRDAVIILVSLLVVVSFVLLIACASVANLLLARAAKRARELALQVALGATRGRIIGQVLSESLVVAAMGGVLGLGVAYLGTAFIRHGFGDQLLRVYWTAVEVDARVLAFALALVLLSALLAGVVPARRASGVNVHGALKDRGLGSTGFRIGRTSRVLVVAQVALSCGLLTVAGIAAREPFRAWRQNEFPFDGTEILTGRISLPPGDYPEEGDWNRFHDQVLDRMDGLPGVTGVALSSSLPGGSGSVWTLSVEGSETEGSESPTMISVRFVGPGYFRILGVHALDGRPFDRDDVSGAPPVAVVNRSFAEHFFPDWRTVGRRVKIGESDRGDPWRTIVGVVPDMGRTGSDPGLFAEVYLPLSQNPQQNLRIMARGVGDPGSLAPVVQASVAGIDPNLPIYELSDLAREISAKEADERVLATLLVVPGLIALLMAGIGLSGILAFSVRSRTREIGIRMAMGAESGSVFWSAILRGMAPVGVGLAIGTALNLGIIKILQWTVPGTGTLDWRIHGVVSAALVLAGILAAVAPACQAVRVNPIEALRQE